MLRATTAQRKGKNKAGAAKPRRVRFPQIVDDARALGVHRAHLYLVLTGQRHSASLKRRYAELQQARAS